MNEEILGKSDSFSRVLTSLFEQCSDATLISHEDGRLLYTNPTAQDLFGLNPDNILQARVHNLFPADALAELGITPQGILENATVPQDVGFVSSSGHQRFFSVTRSPIFHPSGRTLRLFSLRDITRSKRAETHAHLLAEVSRILADANDSVTMLNNVAWVVVPAFVDWCSVFQKNPDGSVQSIVTAHSRKDVDDPLKGFYKNLPLEAMPHHPVFEAIQTARTVSLRKIDPKVVAERTGRPAEEINRILPLDIRSYMALPLTKDHEVFGALSVGTFEREFSDDDQALFEEIASLLGKAIESAQRRAGASESHGFSSGAPRGTPNERVRLNAVTFTVQVDHLLSSPLTQKEFQIFGLIYRAPNQTLSRLQLIEGVWGSSRVSANSLDVHLFNLRKKLSGVGVEILFQSPNFYSIQTKAL